MGAAVIGGGGLLMLLLLAMAGGGSGGTPPAPPTPTPPAPGPEPRPMPGPTDDADLVDIDETDLTPLICELMSAAMPFQSATEIALTVLSGAFVGYDWKSIPAGSERERLVVLATALVTAVRNGQLSCDLPIQINDVPTAGAYYQIKFGDKPLLIIKAAYPWANAAQRVELVRAVTKHPSNGGGIIGQGICIKPRMAATLQQIGPVIFSMYTDWRCNPPTADARFEPGTCYAVVFLPLLTA